MNWYRFKVELVSWFARVVLSVLTSVALVMTEASFRATGPDMVYLTPGEQFMREHPAALPMIVGSLLAFTWGTALWATKHYRQDSRYGERESK